MRDTTMRGSLKFAPMIVGICGLALWSGAARADETSGWPSTLPIDNCGHWPLKEGETISVVVKAEDEVHLIVTHGDDVVADFTLPKLDYVDTAKLEANCIQGGIAVGTGYPNTDRTTDYVYAWDGKTAPSLSSKKTDDPNADFMASLEDDIAAGKDRNVAEVDGGLTYPWNMDWGNAANSAMARATKVGQQLAQSHRFKDAAERTSRLFDLSVRYAYLKAQYNSSNAGDAQESDYTSGLNGWLTAWGKMEWPVTGYVQALNDYGYYLQQIGKDDQALDVFRAVERIAPDRMVNYLNLADSLWALHQTDEAKEAYRKYVAMMKQAGKSAAIPARVARRT